MALSADKDFMKKIIDHHLEKSSVSEEVKEKLIFFKSMYLDS